MSVNGASDPWSVRTLFNVAKRDLSRVCLVAVSVFFKDALSKHHLNRCFYLAVMDTSIN